MAYDACIAEIQRAVGRDLTGDEKAAVADRVRSVLGRLKRAERNGVGDLEAEAKRLIAEDTRMLKEQVLIAKRQKAINARLRQKNYDYLSSVWDDDPAEGIKAVFSGSLADRQGSRDALTTSTDILRHAKVAAFVNELEQHDLVDLARSGTLDLEIRQAAYALDLKDDAALGKLPKEAVDIARIFTKHPEVLRNEQNAAGAWIGKIPGYMHQQSHDMYKIAKAGGTGVPVGAKEHFTAWRDFLQSRLDWDKTLADAPVEKRTEILSSLYNQLSRGYHLQFKDAAPRGAGVGFANIAKRQSHERKLIFKDAVAEQEYFERFGMGDSVYDAVVHHLDSGGRDLALIRKLGPNAQDNLARIVKKMEQRYHKAGEADKVIALRKEFDKQMRKTWPVITGESSISANHAVSAWSDAYLNLERLADLGGIAISSLNDINNAAAQMNYFGDRTSGGFFKQTATVATQLLTSLGRGTSRDERALAAEARVLLEDTHIPVSHMVGDSPIPGALTKSMQFAMKYFGAQWMQNRLRTASLLGTGARYGLHRDLPLSKLPDGMQAALRQYNLSEADWDVIRQAPTRTYKDTPLLNSTSISETPDAALTNHPDVARRFSEIQAREAELVSRFNNRVTKEQEWASGQKAKLAAMEAQGQKAIDELSERLDTKLGAADERIVFAKARFVNSVRAAELEADINTFLHAEAARGKVDSALWKAEGGEGITGLSNRTDAELDRLARRAGKTGEELGESRRAALELVQRAEKNMRSVTAAVSKEARARNDIILNRLDKADAEFAAWRQRSQERIAKSKEVVDEYRSKVSAMQQSVVRRTRTELADKFGNLEADIANNCITAPSSTTRALVNSGLKRGTFLGELQRHALLFKSYTIGYMQSHLGRELHGYHPDRIGTPAALWRAISRPGEGSLAGMTGLIAGGLFWGHLSNILSDISQNHEPTVVPTDFESTKRVVADAFKRSGALGLYGDMVFGQVNDYTSGTDYLFNLAAGPTGRRLSNVVDIGLELYRGDPEGAARKAWKFAYSHVPGRSFSLTRGLTDYWINYNVSEMLNPGYSSRLEQYSEEAGRPFIVSPSGL